MQKGSSRPVTLHAGRFREVIGPAFITVMMVTMVMMVMAAMAGAGVSQVLAQARHEVGEPGPPGRHMDHRFDDPERYAESFDDPARDEWQMPDRVIETLNIGADEVVADIGAGTGYFTVRLATESNAARVLAVDIEPSMVEYIQARAAQERLDNVTAVLASAEGPNLPQRVDLVLIVNTYHHIPQRVAYFAALRSQLRPGGRVAIVDYRPGASGGGPPDEFRFSLGDIDDELSRAGFARESTYDFLPRQHFVIYGPTGGDRAGRTDR